MGPIRGRGAFRGRGRGGRNAGRMQKRGFAAARIDEGNADGHSEPPQSPEPDVDSDSGSESDSEEDTQPSSSAYQVLLRSYQNLNSTKANPPRKRQKTDHSPVRNEVPDDNIDEDSDNTDIENEMGNDEKPVPGFHAASLQAEESGEEDESTSSDPFVHHFANPEDNELATRLKSIIDNQWTTEKLATAAGGKCLLQIPGANVKSEQRKKMTNTKDVNLKPRLVANANKALGDFIGQEREIAPAIFEYQDLLFGARTAQNAGRLRNITCLHALNHIFKTRDRVIKNNAKVSAQSGDDDVEYRDQGFTRPKVLFLLETKQAVVRAIESITELCDFEQQENKNRFLDSFSAPQDKFSDDKPVDFRELFEGNDENEFRIGLKFTRKTLKLYSKFYNSDIIFASALGLRRAIESGDPKKKDYDFLSSIEMVIMEHADATLMQNWEHAEYVFEHLNLQPRDTHGCDFSRVRSWYLDGHSANLRQTIVLSAYLTPKINTLYNKHMKNAFGRLKYTPDYTDGAIETLNYGIKQTFSRFNSPNHITDPDARFKFFNSSLLPQISRLPKPSEGGLGVLVFIPSYLDFVRLRNSLVDSDFSYASISEYTSPTDVRKARSHFMSGKHSLLLYTGRAHHFHRYNIRGVKRVVLYGIPENLEFYKELVGFVGKSVERTEVEKREAWIKVCFSKWERLELERIVGTKRIAKMVNEKGDTFDFV